jgi:hypothetical protein
MYKDMLTEEGVDRESTFDKLRAGETGWCLKAQTN